MPVLVSGPAPCQTRADAHDDASTTPPPRPIPPSTRPSSARWRRPARAAPQPLAHLISGEGRAVGEVFERADPCDPSRIVSRAHAAHAGDRRRRRARRPRRPARVGRDAARRAHRRAAPDRRADRRARRSSSRRDRLGRDRQDPAGGGAGGAGGRRPDRDLLRAHGAQRRLPRSRSAGSPTDEDNVSVMRPYGVFAVICPFNFPFALAVGMAAGALVTGNTVVMKPAEETPWSTGADRRAGRRGRAARRACSTSSTATTRPAARSSPPRSTASPSPARPRPATRSRATLHATPPLRPLIAEMGGKNPAIVTATRRPRRAPPPASCARPTG